MDALPSSTLIAPAPAPAPTPCLGLLSLSLAFAPRAHAHAQMHRYLSRPASPAPALLRSGRSSPAQQASPLRRIGQGQGRGMKRKVDEDECRQEGQASMGVEMEGERSRLGAFKRKRGPVVSEDEKEDEDAEEEMDSAHDACQTVWRPPLAHAATQPAFPTAPPPSSRALSLRSHSSPHIPSAPLTRTATPTPSLMQAPWHPSPLSSRPQPFCSFPSLPPPSAYSPFFPLGPSAGAGASLAAPPPPTPPPTPTPPLPRARLHRLSSAHVPEPERTELDTVVGALASAFVRDGTTGRLVRVGVAGGARRGGSGLGRGSVLGAEAEAGQGEPPRASKGSGARRIGRDGDGLAEGGDVSME